MITLTNGQLVALGAAAGLAGSVMEFTERDADASAWIQRTYYDTFGRSYEIVSETAPACEMDEATATNVVRFTRKAYRVAESHRAPETVLEVLDSARRAASVACPPYKPGDLVKVMVPVGCLAQGAVIGCALKDGELGRWRVTVFTGEDDPRRTYTVNGFGESDYVGRGRLEGLREGRARDLAEEATRISEETGGQ